MNNWSKIKVFFLLILLAGTLVHLSVNLSYFYLIHEPLFTYLEIKDYFSALFLIPLLFIVFSTIVFTKKISGFFKRIFGALVVLLFQFLLLILTSAPFALLEEMRDRFTSGIQ